MCRSAILALVLASHLGCGSGSPTESRFPGVVLRDGGLRAGVVAGDAGPDAPGLLGQETADAALPDAGPTEDASARTEGPPEGDRECGEGALRCGTGCVAIATDPAHCGRCGNACASGSCSRGSCEPPCYRDSDCDPRAATPGAGYSRVCFSRRRARGIGPPRGCSPGACGVDEVCEGPGPSGRCVPAPCRRHSDCSGRDARCLAPDGDSTRRCLQPSHCAFPAPLP